MTNRITIDKEEYISLLIAQVDLIKTQEGYLDLYVSKANPEMTGKCLGVSYSAAVGVPIETTDIYGYTFSGYTNKGLFLDSSGVPTVVDGTTTFKFKNTLDEDSVIRLKDLREYLEIYKVGDLYLTIDSTNPSTRLGYGTWVRYGEGKALVGVSSPNSTNPTTNFSPFWFSSVTILLINLPQFSQQVPCPSIKLT